MSAANVTGKAPRVLVVYATRHGSTEKVAQTVADVLAEGGFEVDVRPIAESPAVEGYDAVVVGAPMIMGWHRGARRFVKQRREALSRVPAAYFMTAMALTDTGADAVDGVPVFKDPWLAKVPRAAGKLGFRERYAAPEKYLGDVLKAVPQVRPRAVAFVGGSLDLTTMNVFEKLFVLLVVRATPGDVRNWKAIREWAESLGPKLAE
jgi:menaquinone-dependent protoporphyrinogen IX oxidase